MLATVTNAALRCLSGNFSGTQTSNRRSKLLYRACALLALALLAGVWHPVAAYPTPPDISTFDSLYPGLVTDTMIIRAVEGDVLAQLELGNRLAAGSGGLPRNPSAAASWYEL